MIARQQPSQIIAPSPAPAPPKSSAGETKQPKTPKSSAGDTKRPKTTMLAALRQAVVQAWTARGSAPVAEAPEKTVVGGQRSEVRQPKEPVVPPKPQPPAWVNAPPRMQDDAYIMSVSVGPFTTPLECERKLPAALQGAVAEYAELSFGSEAAAVRLPDDALQQLVRERFTEVRVMEIDGGSQEMISLDALLVFDADMQKKIKVEAQRPVITKRVQGAAVVFGGVLGLLALAWGGLRWTTRRQQTVGRDK
jgi:hypothetical protein